MASKKKTVPVKKKIVANNGAKGQSATNDAAKTFEPHELRPNELRPLTDRTDKVRRQLNADISSLREILELSTTDFVWLVGSLPHARTVRLGGRGSEKSRQPIKGASLSILARVLFEAPELCPVPETPPFAEVFQKASVAFDAIKQEYGLPGSLSKRRFSLLMGMSGWSGIQWAKQDNQSPVTSRLFLLLNRLIDAHGSAGLLWYMQVLDREARSRGFEHGLYDVFKQGRWKQTEDEE